MSRPRPDRGIGFRWCKFIRTNEPASLRLTLPSVSVRSRTIIRPREGIVKKFLTLLVALCAVASAGLAQANPVTYVFTGVADGSVGGTPFTAQTYTFSVFGDSSTVQNSSPPFSNVLNGGSISITGTACAAGCTITNPGTYL